MFRPLSKSKSKIVHLLQSEVIPERVTLLEELGQGAFGKVEVRETIVAVKVLLGKRIRHI